MSIEGNIFNITDEEAQKYGLVIDATLRVNWKVDPPIDVKTKFDNIYVYLNEKIH